MRLVETLKVDRKKILASSENKTKFLRTYSAREVIWFYDILAFDDIERVCVGTIHILHTNQM